MRPVLLLILLGVLSCKSTPDKTEPKEAEELILTGITDPGVLQHDPHAEWYKETRENYKSALQDSSMIKEELKNVEMEIFFGNWCSDSQRELPAFHRILSDLGIGIEKIKHIALDRDKMEPGNLQESRNIELVPTFIFLRDSIELGRIVESPENSLEEDMLRIIRIQGQ